MACATGERGFYWTELHCYFDKPHAIRGPRNDYRQVCANAVQAIPTARHRTFLEKQVKRPLFCRTRKFITMITRPILPICIMRSKKAEIMHDSASLVQYRTFKKFLRSYGGCKLFSKLWHIGTNKIEEMLFLTCAWECVHGRQMGNR